MNIRNEIKYLLTNWLETQIPDYANFVYVLFVLLWIALVWVIVHAVLHKVVGLFLQKSHLVNNPRVQTTLFKYKLFRNVALVLQGGVVAGQAAFWLTAESQLTWLVHIAAQVWMLIFGLLAFFSLVNAIHDYLHAKPSMMRFPLKGVFQTFKLIALLVISITVFGVITDKSPLILFSGLGAISAVLLLVFKDPILGLVSGVQLSANNMLAIGDWLEMPKYDADGNVLDISLTTVKVQNWDNTITTIPTYALISESFKNWRGMSESGGRRIKRSILLDTKTIHFLDQEDMQRLNKAKLLSQYLTNKIKEIETDNHASATDLSSLVNGRRLTNVGTLRNYLLHYLKAHPKIHADMTLLVRQLGQTEHGLPLQIYCFTNTTSWSDYENIQSDIFDHIFAVLPEFGLKVHESPTGYDVAMLSKNQ